MRSPSITTSATDALPPSLSKTWPPWITVRVMRVMLRRDDSEPGVDALRQAGDDPPPQCHGLSAGESIRHPAHIRHRIAQLGAMPGVGLRQELWVRGVVLDQSAQQFDHRPGLRLRSGSEIHAVVVELLELGKRLGGVG